MKHIKQFESFSNLNKEVAESILRTNIKKYLEENCSNFLNISKMSDKRQSWSIPSLNLWRCSSAPNGVEVLPGVWRVSSNLNRNPVDMPESTHIKLNDEFIKKFGWSVRNGIFCLKDKLSAQRYSLIYSEKYNKRFKIYLFIPVDDFKYCWSPKYNDLYTEILGYPAKFSYGFTSTTSIAGYKDKIESIVGDKEIKEIVSTYKDTDLEKSGPNDYGYIYDQCEISINCKEYLLIDPFSYTSSSSTDAQGGYDFWNW
jgi:hypothetical protein